MAATITITRMTEDLAALSRWMQLHDSAFPVGRMVHSNGVENWLYAHADAVDHTIERLVLDYVTESVAQLDAVITGAAWAAQTVQQLTDLDDLLWSYKTSANARTASQQPGVQLATTARRVGLIAPDDQFMLDVVAGRTPGNLAVVEGTLQASLGISQRVCVLGTLRSALAAVLSAAVRLGRIGAMRAQQVLAHHNTDLADLVDICLTTPLDALVNNTFHLEIHGMQHERCSPRLFAT